MAWHWYFSALALAGGACLAAYALYAWRHRRASAGAALAVVLAAAGWWAWPTPWSWPAPGCPPRLRAELDRPDRTQVLDGLGATITESLGRLRQLAFELEPPPLDQVGLAAAIDQYARSVGRLAGFRVHVEDHLTGRLPVELQEIAYRIAQEALANVRAHARAQRVTIWLEDAEDHGLRLRVSDDGGGFLPGIGRAQPGPDHLGLVSMREQAAMAGGWCRVASAPRMGTTVEVWLPA